MFKKYQHLERFGTTEVENINFGKCYVFPKIDGTNGSLWSLDGCLQAGSRNRHLSVDKDNGGFYAWALQQENIIEFFKSHSNLRLYGEWLIPHSLKTYRESAWRNFYVFDVYCDTTDTYLVYEEYSALLDTYGIQYVPPISIINSGQYDNFIKELSKNVFLIEDGKGTGEGIVIKNYEYKNKFGRITWAKIVTSEFKETHAKNFGINEIKVKPLVEEAIVKKYVTTALCEKEFEKIKSESGWESKMIPRLLNTVFYSLVKEDCWEFTKEHNFPTINFNTLRHFVFSEVKVKLPHLF